VGHLPDIATKRAAISTVLGAIFGKLICLETLTWFKVGMWDNLSPQLKSASAMLFRSSKLTSIYLYECPGLPLNSTLDCSPVKNLVLSNVQLLCTTSSSTEIVLPYLEDLNITSYNPQDIQLVLPKLQRLTVSEDSEGPCNFAQMVIKASKKSLEKLWWIYERNQGMHYFPEKPLF
jgi:hypothetical protein